MSDKATTVQLDYGSEGLPLNLRGLNTTVLRPRYIEGLPDEHAAFIESVRNPYGTQPLRELVTAGESLAVVIPDITRALPSDRLLPWLFEELRGIKPEDVTIIVGTGTHRGNTHEELLQMVGPEIMATYRIINHDSRDASTLLHVGRSPYGYNVSYTADYVKADRRILMGFIEPHFMAGFSGGYKATFPGIADLNAIQAYHGFTNIAHPKSTWGILEGNPTQNHVRAAGELLSVDFLVNVTLNTDRQITGYFCGEVTSAHEAGCAFSRETAMVRVTEPFPIVVTTNSGFPLDLNLYQSVKGMSAAHLITTKDGLIIAASRCNDGFPEHGAFKSQLLRWTSVEEAWAAIRNPDFSEPDQWQTQKLLQILRTCRVSLFSELDPELVQRAHLTPIEDVRGAINAELTRLNKPDTPIAVVPEGPLTIPYVG